MKPVRPSMEAVEAFLGLDTEQHPVQRDPGLLQVDEGSTHEQLGVWQPRRGWTHANVTKKAAAISAVIAVELADGDCVAVIASGQNLYSEATFDE